MKLFYIYGINPVTEEPENKFAEEYVLKAINHIPEEFKNDETIYYAVKVPSWISSSTESKYFKMIESLLNHFHGFDNNVDNSFKNVHIIGYRHIYDEYDLERSLTWLEKVEYRDRVFYFDHELDQLVETTPIIERDKLDDNGC